MPLNEHKDTPEIQLLSLCFWQTLDNVHVALQLPNKIYAVKLPAELFENIKTKKLVLVHGEGFGAWCWYKTIALLEETRLVPTTLYLTGSGIDMTGTNNVTTLIDYSKPLIDYLKNLPEDEKVILVGHSVGGACVSYALEHFPN